MSIDNEIRWIADKYADNLRTRVDQRIREMVADDSSHYLIYKVLGVTDEEGKLIDVYQNKSRFLYTYAGSFLEKATIACFLKKYPDSGSVRIPNTIGQRPKTFEIDCLVEERNAIEVKWRDATTDGDHISKEHTRMQSVKNAGYKPIRVMFYYPNRTQVQRVQKTLETLYVGADGEYHYGDDVWDYIQEYTEVDLIEILETIAKERADGS